MLEASVLSFDKADSSGLVKIFSKAVSLLNSKEQEVMDSRYILTSDDLELTTNNNYDYYEYKGHQESKLYNGKCEAETIGDKIKFLNSAKKEKQDMTLNEIILDAKNQTETNGKNKRIRNQKQGSSR